MVDVPAASALKTNEPPAAGTTSGLTLPPVVTCSVYGGMPPVMTNRNVPSKFTDALFGVTTSGGAFGVGVGFGLWLGVGTGLGVGTAVGAAVGFAVGTGVGAGVGLAVGCAVGATDEVGAGVGHEFGVDVAVGPGVGEGWNGGGWKKVPLSSTLLMNTQSGQVSATQVDVPKQS